MLKTPNFLKKERNHPKWPNTIPSIISGNSIWEKRNKTKKKRKENCGMNRENRKEVSPYKNVVNT
jgi:hypothetical protein